MTSEESQNWKIVFCFLMVLVCLFTGSISPQDTFFFPNFLAYTAGILTIPVIAFFITHPRVQIATGMLIAFTITFMFDYVYETKLYRGPNSMPFILYGLICAPLCLVGSLAGNALSKRYAALTPLKQATLVALLGGIFGSSPILLALVKY